MRKTRFTEDVVTSFLSGSDSQPAAGKKEEPAPVPADPFEKENLPHGWKINREVVESKTKRVQLLMQPSLHAKVRKAAQDRGLSVNDYIHRLLAAHIDQLEEK